jgi:spore maturation protein CgeB
VYDGLSYGLQQLGVEVIPYRLDQRIPMAGKVLNVRWRQLKKWDRDLPKPNVADVQYQAAVGAVEMALRRQVDVVIIVSAMFFHLDVIQMMKNAHITVTVLFTESPYDTDKELRVAKIVDGCWVNERSVLPKFKAVNPNAGYLPHGWHPEKHRLDLVDDPSLVPAHDVVFVGSGFQERIDFFNAIDWTGIDLGLYGVWKDWGLKPQAAACIMQDEIDNAYTAALYRRAKVCLNLYRNRDGNRLRVSGESLSPRAYELAACGSFHLSEYRPEVAEVFGDRVPTFTTPVEAAALIRLWLANDQQREAVAAELPACVAEASWVSRATTVLGDLQALLHLPVREDLAARSA